MQAIGIDIGGTTTKAGLVDETGGILEAIFQPTVTDSVEGLLDGLASIVEELRHQGHPHGIGLGIPGLRSKLTGAIEFSPNLPCLNGVNLETRLSERSGSPVVGRNDADMSAWGEFTIGAGVGTTELACLTLGTGVGSGLILAGRPYSGIQGYAAEAGHIVVDPEGLPCPCGGRGCLETVLSAAGVTALAQRKLNIYPSSALHRRDNPLTAEDIHKAALKGDPLSINVLSEAGCYLGLACASLINLLNLEMIVIGGGLSAAGELLLKSARAEAQQRAYPQAFSSCRISVAKLGNNAGMVGAALLAMKQP